MTELVRELRCFLNPECHENNSWSGHNASWQIAPFVQLRARLAGPVAQPSGYLCDIREIDNRLRAALNATIAALQPPARYDEFLMEVARRLNDWTRAPMALVALELHISPFFSVHIGSRGWHMLLITRQYEFSAAHRLHCADWSDDRNRTTFGKCNNPAGHGHNYLVDIVVEQPVDAAGEQRIALKRIDDIVKQRVIDRLDHKHLNIDVPEFAQRNPSVEHIAEAIWNWLEGQLEPARLYRVRVYETPKTWADVLR